MHMRGPSSTTRTECIIILCNELQNPEKQLSEVIYLSVRVLQSCVIVIVPVKIVMDEMKKMICNQILFVLESPQRKVISWLRGF